MSLEDEARKAYLAKKNALQGGQGQVPSVPGEQEKLEAKARAAYRKKLQDQPLLDKLNRKFQEGEEGFNEFKKSAKINAMDLLRKTGDAGLDAALMLGSTLEYPIRKTFNVQGEYNSDKARKAISSLQNRDISDEPTTWGGHIGAGLGSAFGSSIMGGGAAKIGSALLTKKATPKLLQEASKRASAANFAEKMAKDMFTKEGLGLTGISGLASGQFRTMGADSTSADVAGGVFPVGAQFAMGKALPTIGALSSWAQRQLFPTMKQAESMAGRKLSELMGPQYYKAVDQIESHNPALYPKGYNPTTAEITENAALAAEQRRRRDIPHVGGNLINKRTTENNEILRAEIENLGTKVDPSEAQNFAQNYDAARRAELKAANITAEKNLAQNTRSQFGQTATPEEAGRNIQNVAEQERTLLDEARAPAKARFQAIQQSPHHKIAPSDTLDLIREEQKSAKGEALTSLKRAENYLQSNEGAHLAGIDGESIPMPSALEVHRARGQITDDIRAAQRAGRTEEASALRRVRNRLDIEVEQKYPELTRAREQYRAESRGYNALTEHPALGADIAMDEFGEGFKRQASDVANKYIKGQKAAENAKALLPIIERNPMARETVENYINDSLIYDLFDKEGNVTIASLDAWKKNNPGAFILYRDLPKKLSNVKNSRQFVDQLIEKNADHLQELQTSAAKGLLGNDPNKLVRGVFTQKNSAKRIEDGLALVNRDPTGTAKEGYKQAITDEVKHIVQTLGHSNTAVGIEKYHKFYADNQSALAKIYDPKQMEVLEKIDNVILSRNKAETLGKGAGSETAGKTALGQMMGYLWHQTPGGPAGIIGTGAQIAAHRSNKLMQDSIAQAMVDPEFAAKLLKTNKFTPKQQTKYVEDALKQSYRMMNQANASKLHKKIKPEDNEDNDYLID